MIPLTTAGLVRNFEEAADLRKIHVPQEYFSARYEGEAEWAIGPFEEDASLTFTAQGQWPDPTGTGWTSSALFNPSLITDGNRLVLFYRASPTMESMASRIGMATHDADRGWADSKSNPIIYPTLDNELYGCEDPKIYRKEGQYFLFYHGVFPIDPVDASAYPSPGYPLEGVGCDLNLAVSDDLQTWTKLGRVVPHSVSRLWCKGAVIPRDPEGNAIRINGEFLMYLSEGCNGTFQVGRSDDLINWTFEEQPYLDLTPLQGRLHEVACAAAGFDDQGRIVLDFFYRDADGQPAAAQALYHSGAPFTQIDLNKGGSLSWGGLLGHEGTWIFPQGWSAPQGTRSLYFYRSSTGHGARTQQPSKSVSTFTLPADAEAGSKA